MTRETILALSGRELDAAVGRHITGHSVIVTRQHGMYQLVDREGVCVSTPEFDEASAWGNCPAYSSDANACRLMEAEIERWGLYAEYVRRLFEIRWPFVYQDHVRQDAEKLSSLEDFYKLDAEEDIFALMTVPLDQKCRAGLLAVLETGGDDNAE